MMYQISPNPFPFQITWRKLCDFVGYVVISFLIMTITIFLNLIGALTALFFTTGNCCVGLKLDSEIRQLAVIGYLKLDSYISQSY